MMGVTGRTVVSWSCYLCHKNEHVTGKKNMAFHMTGVTGWTVVSCWPKHMCSMQLKEHGLAPRSLLWS
jgi:hypothetical protein